MSKKFWLIIAVIAVAFVGLLIYNNKASNKGSGSSSSGQPSNHLEGNLSSKVKLVEYGDYQCPICGEYFSTVQQIAAKYNTQITFQFRNLPLTSIHQFAFVAARAAEAASLQGKFWQMHDTLYENQNTWSQSTNPQAYFDQYAQQLGLNVSKFDTDFASAQVNNTINADLAAFQKTGNEMATPTFFLNGKKLNLADLVDSNGPSVAKFSTVIDNALKAAGSSTTSSTSKS